MTKDQLFQMAAQTSRKVVERNMDLINEQIRDMSHKEDGSKISLQELPSVLAALTITIAPDISAAVTAQMLVDLGLVTLDDA